jgi:V/A-type H+-transporting ATPase subunit K
MGDSKMDFNMVGPALALGLSCIGSSIGSGIAGMALHGVMSRVEEGHGKFIGMSVMASSHAIYGFILMLLLSMHINSGTVSAMSAVGIGLSSGTAIMVSAIYLGKCVATAIQASARQPAIYGKCWVTIALIESFALFAFVFAILIMG